MSAMTRTLAGSAALLMMSPWAAGTIITLGASHDNTLIETPGGNLSNGAGGSFFAGTTVTGSIRRSVISFDASSIPAGSIVTSVTLTLHMSRTPTGTEPVTVHRLLASWGEAGSIGFMGGGNGAPAQTGDATWLYRFYPSTLWATPGGDFDEAPHASTNVTGIGFYSWSSSDLVADVQSWIDDPSHAFGWMVRAEESIEGTAKRFDSRENFEPTFRPQLAVEYTPVPGPTSSVLVAAGALIAGRGRCRNRGALISWRKHPAYPGDAGRTI